MKKVVQMLYYAKTVDYIEEPVYHYDCSNPSSITKDGWHNNIYDYPLLLLLFRRYLKFRKALYK